MISLSDITSFDVIVVLIFLLFVIRGTWIGFMRQLAIFLALIGSYFLAGRYTGLMIPHVSGFIDNPKAVFYVSLALLFLLGVIFLFLLAKLLRLVMEVTMTTWFDRTLGMILGLLKAAFLTSLLYMALSSSLISANELLKKSMTSPILARGAEFIQQVIRDQDLRKRFLPREPAILPKALEEMEIKLPPIFNPDKEQGEEEAGEQG